MSQVVIRGESVYECDVCDRRVRLPTNRQGLDVIQRCIITAGCQGKLHQVTTLKDINSTPTFPPEVEGVQDWFARNILYTHHQNIRTSTWVVRHNLQNVPILHTFVHRTIDGESVLTEHDPIEVQTIDANTTRLIFAAAESGQVQCVSLSTKNTTNYNNVNGQAQTDAILQLSSTNGELTIATLDLSPTIDVALTYVATEPITVSYVGIDSAPSIHSPWVGANTVIVNGRKYAVRSFNLTQTATAPSYFTAGLIADGTAFFVSSVNNNPINTNDVLFLMSNSPHSNVDRVYNKYVEAKSISTTTPETFYGEGKGYTSQQVVKSTYPLILVV